jgi:hypothetical protein
MSGNALGGAPTTLWSDTITASAGPVGVKTLANPAVAGSGAPAGGSLWSWKGANAGAACYLMFFDSATSPAGGAVPLFAAIPLGIGTTTPVTIVDGFTRARKFKTGLWWAVSSTQATYTSAAIPVALSVEFQ